MESTAMEEEDLRVVQKNGTFAIFISMLSSGSSVFLRRGFLCCLVLIALVGFLKVGMRAWFETWGSFHSDAAVYGTVGRGILNGLTPYADLYDNKTPVIYFMIALSFLFTGSMALFSWLQGMVILLFPFAILWPLHLRFGARSHPILCLFGFIFGCVLALYSAEYAGQLLPESFGAFFGALLIGMLFAFDDGTSRKWTRVVVISTLLLLTIGMKEPFVLSIIGSSLVVLPWRRAIHALALPLALATMVGLLVLLLLGLLGPYFTTHVGHMLGHHIHTPWGTLHESPWLRFVDIFRLWKNMQTYSPFLPWVLFPVWIGALTYTVQAAHNNPERLCTGTRWLVGSALVTTSVGLTGDFYGHHFIVAVPLFVAAFLVCAQASFLGMQRLRDLNTAIMTIICTLVFVSAPRDFSAAYEVWNIWAQERKDAALVVDAVLDRCDVDRYFFFVDRPDGLPIFTRHSPLGPLFTQYSRFIGARQEYLDGFSDATANAPILVMRTEQEGVPLDIETLRYFRTSFTETPPTCAGSFRQPLPYRILFRREKSLGVFRNV